MAKQNYIVSSPEGAAHTGAEEGATVALDLEEDRELALCAAGWLEKVGSPNKAMTTATEGK